MTYNISKKVLSFNDVLLLLSMCLMIIVTIFNANEYVAGLAFVLYPSLFLLGSGFIYGSHHYNNRINILAILLLMSASISTYLSPLELILTTFANLAFVIISFVVVSSCTISDRVFKKMYKFYITFSTVVCVVLLFNYIFHIGIQVFSEGNERVSIVYGGIAKDVNYLSCFVLPCYVYYLYRGCMLMSMKDFVKAGLVFVAMFVAGSRSCFLSMMAVSTLVIWAMLNDKNNKHKGLIIMSLILGSCAVFYYISDSVIFARTTNFSGYSENSRLLIWGFALEAFYDNILIGSGVESGSYYSMLYTPWKTHNCFIDILTGQGLLGSTIVILLFFELSKVAKNNRIYMVCTMIAFFVPLFFVNGYECATMWTPMIICRFLHDKCKSTDIMYYIN